MSDTIIDRFDGTEYSWMSNFYLAPIEYGGLTYPSSEHAYQAAKTLDVNLRRNFTGISVTAAKLKKMGMALPLRKNWENIKASVMLDIVRIKFKTHKNLADKLMATGDVCLIEGNTWHDNFFGDCSCQNCEHIVGKNYLGKILMRVRQELVFLETKKHLTFDQLRHANIMRLPTMKNKKGEVLHDKPDGSDWSMSDWTNALTGEVGELCGWRKEFLRGNITEEEFRKEAAKGLADIVAYCDLIGMQIGIDLGTVVRDKFNEVSERVESSVKL